MKKYYEEAKYNAAFDRCVDVMSQMLQKYGHQVLDKLEQDAPDVYKRQLLGFLLDSGLATYVINPLHTNLDRKSLSLRRTKTDRIDARTIAMMLMSCLLYTSRCV